MIQELKTIYNLYPRRFFTTWSWKINNFDEFMHAFQNNYQINRCSSSIYNYDGNEEGIVLDRIAFDIDGDNAYEHMKRVHHHYRDRGLKHYVLCSGQNFHVIVKVSSPIKYPKDTLKNYYDHVNELLSIKNDPSMYGNVSHNLSIPFSFNFRRGRYVRSLTAKEIGKLSHVEIIELCKKQGDTVHFFGDEGLDLTDYDYKRTEKIPKLCEEVSFMNDKLLNALPSNTKALLIKKAPEHQERLDLILGMVNFGLSKNQIYDILKERWTPSEFYHSIVYEKTLDWAIRKRYEVLKK